MQNLHRRLPGVFFPDELAVLSRAFEAGAAPGETRVDREGRALALLAGGPLGAETAIIPAVRRLRAIGLAAGLSQVAADRIVERTLQAALNHVEDADMHPTIEHWLESMFLARLMH